MMNEQIDNVTKDDAKALLDSINQQKQETSNNAQMPNWFNLFCAVLITWFVSFEYFDSLYEINGGWQLVSLFGIFAGLYVWLKILKKRGIKPKVFRLTKINIIGFLIGVFTGAFFSDLLIHFGNAYGSWVSYLMMVLLAVFIFYLSKKYPLSESISEVKHSANR